MLKRVFDIFASALGLILIVPFLFIIAVSIKLKMPGPVFFKQMRTGRFGKPFTIYKFRTMVENHHGGTVSVKGENRITPLGAFLRKYKLDELPELWNVLIGDMSLVGPRPDMAYYTERLSGDELLILTLRPGITGPATLAYAEEEALLSQVNDPQRYNDEIIWPDKVRINLNYYYKRSFILDMVIILKTLFRIGR